MFARRWNGFRPIGLEGGENLLDLPSAGPVLNLGLEALCLSFLGYTRGEPAVAATQDEILPVVRAYQYQRSSCKAASRGKHSPAHPEDRAEIVASIPDVDNPVVLLSIS